MDDTVQQLDLFSSTLPRINLEHKTIKLIECFAGIGSQYQALKTLSKYSNDSFKVVSHKIVEWAFNSYVIYNEMHIKDFTDYSIGKTKEEMLDRIRGTSTNYNDPLNDRQLTKKPIEWIKRAYNSCIATNNLVNIMNVHGDDLEIKKDKDTLYVLSYSFPCQDISLAGLSKGLEKSQAEEGGTRSGLLWEVERILDELSIKNNLPEILLLENVPPLLSEANGNLKQFQKWEQKLGSLGYTNFVKILNGKEFGIPQNRERVFCISILGQYTYNFPAKIPLKYKLKDFLNKNVDEKYYLSDKDIERISNWKAHQKPLDNVEKNENISPTITARGAGEDHSGMILIPIKNNTEKGYTLAKDGDGIDISGRMDSHRGTVQKDSCQTLSTLGGKNVGVVVNEKRK